MRKPKNASGYAVIELNHGGIPDDELDKYADCGASGTPGMIRVSFGIYNTEEEVDEFLKVLAEAIPAVKAYVAEQIEELGEETQAFDPSF